MSSGVAHAARHPRASSRTLGQKPRRSGKPAPSVARCGAPEGSHGTNASGRYVESMTERVPGESARRAIALAAHRPARRPRGEHSSNDECSLIPCVGGRVPLPSFVDRRPRDVVEALEARGHAVDVSGRRWSSAQSIVIDPETGVMSGGSDPRADGEAAAY